MYKPVDVMEVRIWGQRVGAVARDPKLNFYVFRYEPKFVKTGIELAPLTMPLAQSRDTFVFPSLSELTYKRLPSLLADALPDDFGNALIDAWMATQGVERESITTLDRLAYMGTRGMGALEFKSARGPSAKKSTTCRRSAPWPIWTISKRPATITISSFKPSTSWISGTRRWKRRSGAWRST